MTTTRSSNLAIGWVEQGLVPDRVVRLGIRRLAEGAAARDRRRRRRALGEIAEAFVAHARRLGGRAPHRQGQRAALRGAGRVLRARARAASQVQLLRVPRRHGATLADAEAAALATTCERAGLVDGQRILELGCGWGSLTLWMAERYPASRITALSNSRSQRRFIEAEAERRGLANVEVLTEDFNRFDRPASASTASSRSRCSSICATGRRRFAGSRLARARRTLLHARVRPPLDALRLRRPRRERLDEPALLLRRNDAERRPRAALPGRPARSSRRWRWNGEHYAKTSEAWLAEHGRAPRRALAALRVGLRQGRARRRGGCAGASSSCRAPSCSATTAASAGVSRTICSRPALVGCDRMTPVRHAALLGFAAALVLALGTWVASLVQRDVSLVDRMWSLLIAAPAAAYAVGARAGRRPALQGRWPRSLVVWAVRLAIYVSWRNWGHGEDRRYTVIRARNEPHFALKSIYLIFVLQAVLAWLVSLPFLAAAAHPVAWTAIDTHRRRARGRRLRLRGRRRPAARALQGRSGATSGQVMDRGVWRYSRHPNYFGEFCVWWGFFLMALAAGGWWSVVSPLIMTGLLLKVSGVALLEKDIGERRPGVPRLHRAHQRVLPWPPRRSSAHDDQRSRGRADCSTARPSSLWSPRECQHRPPRHRSRARRQRRAPCRLQTMTSGQGPAAARARDRGRHPALHGRLVRHRQHPDLHREGRALGEGVVRARAPTARSPRPSPSAPTASTGRAKDYHSKGFVLGEQRRRLGPAVPLAVQGRLPRSLTSRPTTARR